MTRVIKVDDEGKEIVNYRTARRRWEFDTFLFGTKFRAEATYTNSSVAPPQDGSVDLAYEPNR